MSARLRFFLTSPTSTQKTFTLTTKWSSQLATSVILSVLPLAEFRAQGRGGVGAKGGSTRDQDFIEYIYQATMHNTMLFFTAKGRCYWLRVYEIEEGTRQSKGRAIQNMLNIEPDDRINACLHVKKLKDEAFCENHYVVFATQKGVVKKNAPHRILSSTHKWC